MKTTNRIPKAIAIVVILGFGMINNVKNKLIMIQAYDQISNELENTVESESTKTSDNKLYIYTKSIIKSSIQQVIFNL
ncbi:MAG: hypothetical protein PHS59_07865 [Paludibacter sp.]|nr:hypothetical protein [Paludibacter sp.]